MKKMIWMLAGVSSTAAAQEMTVGGFTVDSAMAVVKEQGLHFGMKLLGAIALWVVGKMLIGWALKLFQMSMAKAKMDGTLTRYLVSTLNVLLTIALVAALLGFFGVETTSFAALMAGAGLAIGTAWGGLLSNFASGVFIIILKPYKTGDFIQAGGVVGTVKEIGLFATGIDTPDNVHTIVGNAKIFSDNIQNFSTNPHRRVDLVAQLAHEADHAKAVKLLSDAIAKIPNVLTNPAPVVEILEFNLAGPVLAVRPSTHTDNYWQVYFDGNRAIREVLGEAGYPVPWQKHQMNNAG